MLQLPDIPVGVHETEVDDADITPDAFNILQIPERKSIVITVSKYNSVWRTALQHGEC